MLRQPLFDCKRTGNFYSMFGGAPWASTERHAFAARKALFPKTPDEPVEQRQENVEAFLRRSMVTEVVPPRKLQPRG